MRVWAIGFGTLAMTALGTVAVADAGPHDKACVAEIRAAGDWGKNVNPGKATFVRGSADDDVIPHIPAGVAYCGMGGNDTVIVNDGWFYGGAGIDTVLTNNGVVDGGAGTDLVNTNTGVFRGRGEPDLVLHNSGYFDGGPGRDSVLETNSGTCVDVEVGC